MSGSHLAEQGQKNVPYGHGFAAAAMRTKIWSFRIPSRVFSAAEIADDKVAV
jgi:hypothetical protein